MSQYIGHGCIRCQPSLFPHLGAVRPCNSGHYRADWFYALHPDSTLAVKIDGAIARRVEECQVGDPGWIIRYNTHAGVLSESGAHDCRCGSGETEYDVWIGRVTVEEVARPKTLIPISGKHLRPGNTRRFVGGD